ncbi:hypothetical protein B0H99_107106 [Planomicrobium soli]|uniref:Uncharacterized protein n=1 Tax=Planomicrobium soli TaxID=1176648 RepID=A0A2P8GQR7_9BACL|nr:hypothetical protein [Planomicrobium soli]PSL36285.1 hypothetical protein B0H99_107106 [Planomicrobium soli]
MRKSILFIVTVIMSITMAGCAPDEVIRVGTPFISNGTTGAEFHTDITDSRAITDLRTVLEMEEEIEQPKDLTREPDVVFTIDRPQESVSEIWRYIWYENDGSAFLSSGERDQGFFALTKEQTDDLKRILK